MVVCFSFACWTLQTTFWWKMHFSSCCMLCPSQFSLCEWNVYQVALATRLIQKQLRSCICCSQIYLSFLAWHLAYCHYRNLLHFLNVYASRKHIDWLNYLLTSNLNYSILSLDFGNNLQVNKFGFMGPGTVEDDGLWGKQPSTSSV